MNERIETIALRVLHSGAQDTEATQLANALLVAHDELRRWRLVAHAESPERLAQAPVVSLSAILRGAGFELVSNEHGLVIRRAKTEPETTN